MYKAYFGLTRNPFELTPDPASFVSTKRHNEALAALYYGIRWHKGFVVVTGEVGTGKTLVLRCLLRLLKDSRDIAYAYLFNSRLTANEFLQYILSDLGLPASGKNKSELLFDLGQFLLSRGAKRLTTVLIIDEAHHLSDDLLEEVRLLSNLETTNDKLLQIVLVGQPELDEKLESLGLRQLKQRIALRAQLEPLGQEETREYIAQRLQIAGADVHRGPIFSDEAIASVYRYSQGLPRLINTICENGLIAAYASNSATVGPGMIDEVARQFRLEAVYLEDMEKNGKRGNAEVTREAGALPDLFAVSRDLS
jgi:general secretion pathway protein A